MAKPTIHLSIDGGPKLGEALARKPPATIRIGRVVRGNTVAIKDPSISQQHLTIQFDRRSSSWCISDLGAANGTALNGVRIAAADTVPLSDGDVVRIGENTSISVRIVVDDVGVKTVGRRGGGSVRVSKKEEILDVVEPVKGSDVLETGGFENEGSVCAEKGTGLLKKLPRGSRRKCVGDSKSDMVTETEVDKLDPVLESKNLRRCTETGREKGGKSDTDMLESEINANGGLAKEVNSSRILEPILFEGGGEVPKSLPKGKRGKSSKVSKTDVTLDAGLSCSSGAKEEEVSNAALTHKSEVETNLGTRRETRGKFDMVLKTDQVSAMVVGDGIKVLDDVGKELTASVPNRNEKKAPKNLPKRKRGRSPKASKTSEIMDTVVAGSIEKEKSDMVSKTDNVVADSTTNEGEALVDENEKQVKPATGRKKRGKSDGVLKTDQVSDAVAIDGTKKLEDVGKELIASIPNKDEKEEPKNMPKEKRRNTSRVCKTSERVDTAVVDSSEIQDNNQVETFVSVSEISNDVPKNMGRERRCTRTRLSKEDMVLNPIAEENTEVSKPMRRGRSRSNTDIAPNSVSNISKTVERKRSRRSSKVSEMNEASDAIVMDNFNAQNDLKKRETLDTVMENVAEEAANLALDSCEQIPRNVDRKRKTRSNKVLKDDKVSDSTAKDAVIVPKDPQKHESLDSLVKDTTEDAANLGRRKRNATSTRASKKDDIVALLEESEAPKEKPRRAPVRKTRAASAKLSKKEQVLETTSIKGPILSNVENTYQHKETRGNSNKLGQDETEFDKENSYSKHIPCEEGPSSGTDVADCAEPCRVIPKVWNGNGIPNSTSKYKEDSKVTWHATPFEERLEKALSRNMVFP